VAILPIDSRGVVQAVDALRSGFPVVLPMPSPLPYVITGTDAEAVNTAKKRPASQPVGVSVVNIDVIAAHLGVDDGVLPLARWLCDSELVSLLVPVRPGAPKWLRPATSEGMVFFSAAPWLPELAEIIATFEHLYISSANITTGRPATTVAEAGQAFGDDLFVLDGEALRDQSITHGSTTIVRVSAAGELGVARPGINNAAFGVDLAGYADDLSRRWQAGPRSAT
jgi:tRNA A37 threonylcarbamoyladenosine synthetase subunit TsaC/SUA5/YrdC